MDFILFDPNKHYSKDFFFFKKLDLHQYFKLLRLFEFSLAYKVFEKGE